MLTQKQKLSPIGLDQKIDYKDIDLLKLFITEQGKILPRRVTGHLHARGSIQYGGPLFQSRLSKRNTRRKLR